jgi:predicted O-methyltransferase YrrM
MIDSLNDYLDDKTDHGLCMIKPRVLLTYLENTDKISELVAMPFPPSVLGSIPVFDALMLAGIVKVVNPKRVLEFGTFLGYSTRVIIENSENNCDVVSIDLPHGSERGSLSLEVTESALHSNPNLNDDFLRQYQFVNGPRFLNNLSDEQIKRLHLIKADSRKVDATELVKKAGGHFDLIFVDGGHDMETISSDTALAIQVANKNATIVWHDYGSTIHTSVTEFLMGISVSRRIIPIAGTLLAMSHLGLDPITDVRKKDD